MYVLISYLYSTLVNSYPKQELKKRPKEVTKKAAQEALEELDPGDDTSQDAADLSSQETKGNEIIDFPMKSSPKNVLQPEPQQHDIIEKSVEILPCPSSPKPKVKSPILQKMDTKENIRVEMMKSESEERDENFVIESDNIDEKLYSSESESPILAKNPINIIQKPKLFLSSSSISSPKKKKVNSKPLQLKSESEASEAISPSHTKAKSGYEDVSGPEMENDDDFWN